MPQISLRATTFATLSRARTQRGPRAAHVLAVAAIAVGACLWSAPSFAQTADEIEATLRAASSSDFDPELENFRAMAMGGAFVGGGSGAGALHHNPAGILTAALYEGTAGYQRAFRNDLNAIGASIVDSKTNPSIAAGFAYSFGFGRDERLGAAFDDFEQLSDTNNRVRDHDIRAALAFPVVPSKVALGVGIRYLNHFRGSWTSRVETRREVEAIDPITGLPEVDAEGQPVTNTVIESSPKEFELRSAGITLDAGIFAALSDNISLGVAARNILQVQDSGIGRVIEAGLGGYFDALHIEAAWFTEQQADDTFQHGVALGLEYVVDQAPIRTGYRYDGESHFITTGLGVRSERFGGDLAFEQSVTTSQDRRIGASFSLYF